MKHLKLFNDTASYEAWKNSEEYVLPNVVFNEETGVVYVADVEPSSPNLVCVYNVTDISRETKIAGGYVANYYTSMIVDGVEMELDPYYQFDTVGNHTVEFVLIDPTYMGGNAFQNCESLTNVTIPDSVTSIGNYEFQYCTGLTSITCLAQTAPSIYFGTFMNVSNGGTLHVPSGSDYSSWMSTGDDYLGKYNWTIQYI